MSQGAKTLNPAKLIGDVRPGVFRRLMRLFPPIRNTGVRVEHISDDWCHWRFRLPLGIKTRNYVGTHFGGTLYSAMDPHLMLAWMHILGKEFIVWDKAAAIRFKRPGQGTLHGEFTISADQVAEMQALAPSAKVDLQYTLHWRSRDGTVIAEVDKTVHIRRKEPNA